MRILLPVDADIADVVASGAVAESIVVIVAPGRDPLAQALALAAVGPLAIERAPATRINAVVMTEGAHDADVDAAVGFLEGARSTTGQVLTVS